MDFFQTPPTLELGTNQSDKDRVLHMNSNDLVSLKWVKLKHWCNLTGDTRDAVHARRKNGKWTDGVHCKVRDGTLWVNTLEGQSWVESETKRSLAE